MAFVRVSGALLEVQPDAGWNAGPLAVLRELLAEDKLEGRPWHDGDFLCTARAVCGAIGASTWLEPIIGTLDAWRDAYIGTPSPLEHFSASIADTEPGERVSELMLA